MKKRITLFGWAVPLFLLPATVGAQATPAMIPSAGLNFLYGSSAQAIGDFNRDVNGFFETAAWQATDEGLRLLPFVREQAEEWFGTARNAGNSINIAGYFSEAREAAREPETYLARKSGLIEEIRQMFLEVAARARVLVQDVIDWVFDVVQRLIGR